uniref:Uncharacterized protein n=1 Tax=Arion vulgaris TaxID=1028688 RepID=A0A0B7AAA8_9EUPU
MIVLRNKIPVWHKYLKNIYIKPKYFTTSSSFSSGPGYPVFLELSSNIGRIIPLCNFSSRTCFKPQLSKLIRCSPSIFSRHVCLSSNQASADFSLRKGTSSQEQEKLITEMNLRLVNENSFLSWCRNAYLSSVVGVAMITEGTTALAQNAGIGALVVGTMNLFWGTTCHISNLIRLRHVTGMSSFILLLNILGSLLHCLLWIFVLICYIGFLDETNAFEHKHTVEVNTVLPDVEFQRYDSTRVRMKDNEV